MVQFGTRPQGAQCMVQPRTAPVRTACGTALDLAPPRTVVVVCLGHCAWDQSSTACGSTGQYWEPGMLDTPDPVE